MPEQQEDESRIRNLQTRIAYLESINDQLITEIKYVDALLRRAGFVEGLKTLKAAAIEMIRREEGIEDDLEC
jgi:hypothetical protein